MMKATSWGGCEEEQFANTMYYASQLLGNASETFESLLRTRLTCCKQSSVRSRTLLGGEREAGSRDRGASKWKGGGEGEEGEEAEGRRQQEGLTKAPGSPGYGGFASSWGFALLLLAGVQRLRPLASHDRSRSSW
eukprot:746409-Hanusia_phi.AAC.2